MALFYTSCSVTAAGYAKEGSVTAVLRTLDIDIHKWVGVQDFSVFLELAVATTMKSGLSSFIRIQFITGHDLRIDVGETLESTFSADFRRAREIVVDMIDDIGPALSSVRVNLSTIFAIDATLESLRVGLSERTWMEVRDPDGLKEIASDVNWANALERGLPARLKSAEKWRVLKIKGAAVIRNIIEDLRRQPLQWVSVYTIFVLLSQVND
ncbi:hypothetical protein V5799_002860 [Amblyomma americanum]|uniref:Uncharacterized protein n=1 Tax=Amblyomma americanum TaxID=6943 RepID=A0AAQ4DAL8_AMBAM